MKSEGVLVPDAGGKRQAAANGLDGVELTGNLTADGADDTDGDGTERGIAAKAIVPAEHADLRRWGNAEIETG